MSLTPVQRAILVDLLVHGDDKAQNIADRTDYHRNSISRCMKPLVDDSAISHKGGGVYQLRHTGRKIARNLVRGGFNPYTDDS
jgi:predicted transcriptional regulator